MLTDCRALDLTNENGFLCGKILADLGVDVIKVEPPEGEPGRRFGPFWHDIPHPEKSLYWFAYNSNKRGITLNIETADGKEVFKKLVQTADFVLESYPPGYLGSLELDFADLAGLKQDLIMVSITPFGQTGPYAHFQAADIVTMGMSGVLYQTGDPDRPPVHMSLPQACLHAGADGAVGAMMAYYHREASGEGQHIDVSQQQSTAWFLANAIPLWELNGVVSRRSGTFRWSPQSSQRQVWECRDGYVFFNIIGGRTGAKTLRELVVWMDAEGMANDFLKSIDWQSLDMFTVGQETVERISRPIEAFFRAHTKAEIAKIAAERGISVCPLSSMENLRDDSQLKARNFWVEVPHCELGAAMPYPRGFAESSEENFSIRCRAPLIGEHNQEIYASLGLTDSEIVRLKQAGII